MFLPINRKEMEQRGWSEVDFVYVSGDAYVDHPSFGVAIISRVLEAFGYKIGIIAQPDITKKESLMIFGEPRLGFLVTSGNIDSMVNHYTVSKRRRDKDNYSPGGKMGLRPDYATSVYSQKIRQIYPNTKIILGGIEASLRRLAHYDYWKDTIIKSILLDSQADLVLYGMGEKNIVEMADALNSGLDIKDVIYIRGSVWKTKDKNIIPSDAVFLPTFKELKENSKNYAKSFYIQYQNNDPYTAKPLVETYDDIYVIQNLPNEPIEQPYLDWVYALPYERTYHPIYKEGVPAIQEVKYSLAINRGCFGSCSFCAITSHQGRIVQSRSKESVVEEAKKIINDKDFKGYIHDVGGPTANFYHPSCQKQLEKGTCPNKQCLHPTKCSNLFVDHHDYLDILRTLRTLPGVKKVFIRSGIRYDYLMYDKDDTFFKELVEHHISGQLKVAPEHISEEVLFYMQKPGRKLYDRFVKKYYQINQELNKNQYLVPYLMSSHPGCTLKDAIMLSEYIRDNKLYIEQVQDFYPTPSTLATCMYYTGVDPRTMEKVYVAKSKEEKASQRALMQYKNPKNYDLVKRALIKAGRTDLIGNGPNCLIPNSLPPKRPLKYRKR